MTRTDAVEAAPKCLLVIPLGATEQHGPHLPVGTDTLLIEAIAEGAALAAANSVPVVLGPTMSFGSSAHHVRFGGTLSLTTESYYRVLMDLGRSASAGGFRRVFFLNGHGGNHELAQLAARDLALEHPLAVGAGSWWAMAYDALIEAGLPSIRNIPGHAGGFETAAVMAIARHLVRDAPARAHDRGERPSLRADYRTEVHGSWEAMDGFTDSPADATVDLGSRFLEVAVAKVAADLASFYASMPNPPAG
jgi:creatinine amidohydrolase